MVDQLMKVGFLEIYQTFLTIVANSMQDASQLYKLVAVYSRGSTRTRRKDSS